MAGANRDRMKLAVQLVRKGGTMLREPCPQCGGVQVRYKGKVYCTSHEDLSSAVVSEAPSFDTVVAGMREVLLARLDEASAALGAERDTAKQEQIVSLMARYFDLLSKLPKA